MALDTVVVFRQDLVDTIKDAFLRAGVPVKEAEAVAESLVDAEIKGIRTHGVLRVPLYIKRIKAGGIKVPTRLEVIQDNRFAITVDAHDGLGQVAGNFAMGLAIKKAAKNGAGACSVRRTSHFGTAGYYAAMAARSDMIGFACCSATPRLPVWGGKVGLIGNNPFSVAFPSMDPEAPFVLDMANSITAAGRLRVAIEKGERIPEGWALDKGGNPTTDPKTALEGILLPMAGHKGYGIALTVGMLCSVLSGGVWDDEVGNIDRLDAEQKVSNLFMAFDISQWLSLEMFKSGVGQIAEKIHSTPLAPGFVRTYYPGERKAAASLKNLRDGLAIEKRLLEQIQALAEDEQ